MNEYHYNFATIFPAQRVLQKEKYSDWTAGLDKKKKQNKTKKNKKKKTSECCQEICSINFKVSQNYPHVISLKSF